MKTWWVTVKGYGRESVFTVEAETEREAKEKALEARGVSVNVSAGKGK
jgi:hypothetical protein